MAPTDNDLIRRVAKGDNAAFEALMARHEAAVRGRLRRMIRDADAADDLTQEAFLRVWTRAGAWKETGAVKAWLMRIASNLALNHMRTLRRRREMPLALPSHMEDEAEENAAPGWMIDASSLGPDAVAQQIEQREHLWRLVDDLPEAKREVLRLVYDAEMEIQEAAEALGVPEGTVKSRLHHTRKQLAREWEEFEKNGQTSQGTDHETE